MAVTSNPKRTILSVLFIAAFAIFGIGCMETVFYFKGDPYYVHIDDLDYCNEQRAIEGKSGRVISMYRIEEVETYSRAENHNHSSKVQALFSDIFNGNFHNLIPTDVYAHYIKNSGRIIRRCLYCL